MAAITTRRKPASGELDQLRAEVAQLRAELAQLRAAIRSTAALSVGIGYHRAPVTPGGIRTIADVCGLNGVDRRHADVIAALFS